MSVKTLLLAGCTLFATAVTMPALAQSNDTMGQTGTSNEAATNDQNLRQLTIHVKSVDKRHHMVVFQAQVAPEATVEKNGMPIKLDQLRPGDEVRAAFDPQTGKVMKLEIERGQMKK